MTAESSFDALASESAPGEFRVEQELARGGMGVVYQAQDPNIGRSVVVKFLRPERHAQPEAVDRFLAEARITGQLEHPGIVPVYHLGVAADDRPFYAMRHIQGENLATILDRLRQEDAEVVRQYPLNALLNVFQKICDAVAYAHSRQIIHRDLKPENVMIGAFGEVVVMDWGLAKTLSNEKADSHSARSSRGHEALVPNPKSEIRNPKSDQSLLTSAATGGESGGVPPQGAQTLDDTIMGTPGFMAPELAGGQANEADERTDVYSLGAILYAILTLHPPIRGKSAQSMLDRTKTGTIRPPTDYNAGSANEGTAIPLPHCPNRRVPVALSAVAMKALATRPGDRYQSVKELQSEITAYQSGFVTFAEQAGLNRLLLLWILRHKTLVAALTLILVIAGIFTWKLNRTLNELRRTAPAFYELAQTLAASQKLDDALEKVSQSLTLAPGNANYLLFRAHLLQAMLRMDEARDGYAQVLQIDPSHAAARENLALCEKLIAARRGKSEWTMENLMEIYEPLLEQGRSAEAYAVSRHVDAAKGRFVQLLQDRLNQAGITNKLGWSQHRPAGLGGHPAGSPKRFKPGSRNYLYLNLDNSDIADLSPLRGIPLQELSLQDCPNIADLRPLQGMPLVRLTIHAGEVEDLGPLTDSPLEVLEVTFNNVKDLAPLKAIPTLRSLNLANIDMSDLSPLKGLPLESLTIGTSRVTSLEPLRGMPQLTALALGYVRINDLRPLAGLPLRDFRMDHVDVSDISPLRGMPLRILHLSDCPLISDLSPLKECKTLEQLGFPPSARDIEFLRELPSLKEIFNPGKNQPSLVPAAEFWKAYDARKVSRK